MRVRRIDPPSLHALKTLGARHGWLLSAPDSLRVGFGRCLARIELPHGVLDTTPALTALSSFASPDPHPTPLSVTAFASLPFDRSAPGVLEIPEYVVLVDHSGCWLVSESEDEEWRRHVEQVDDADQDIQVANELVYRPSGESYAHAVAVAVERLRRKEVSKVVLARSVHGVTSAPIDPASVARRLRAREPACTIYSLPLPDGRRFVGASPELLVRRDGLRATCHPLAGTIALPPHVDPQDYHAWLLGSSKNLHEHALLADEVVTTLAEHYDSVEADPNPSIVTLRTVAHLGTWIHATSDTIESAPHGLELLTWLHPTAAVGGLPRAEAYEMIRELESLDRGHYAGPVGWVDARGNAEWWIGIRGVMLEGSHFEAWAGAGIVPESDPTSEREETRDKLASVLSSVVVDRV